MDKLHAYRLQNLQEGPKNSPSPNNYTRGWGCGGSVERSVQTVGVLTNTPQLASGITLWPTNHNKYKFVRDIALIKKVKHLL